MNSKWTFIGGILAGIAAAAVSVELEGRKSGSRDAVDKPEKLALPENEGR